MKWPRAGEHLESNCFDLIHHHDFECQHRRHTEWALTEGVAALLELKKESRIGNVSFGTYPMDVWHRIFSKQWDYDAAVDRLKMNSLEGVPNLNCQQEPTLGYQGP